MTTVKLERDRLLSIVLNHLYPDGNVTTLIDHARLEWGGDIYRLRFGDLPMDHWAFTQLKKPTRYYLFCDPQHVWVIDGEEDRRRIAECDRYNDAAKIAKAMNHEEGR